MHAPLRTHAPLFLILASHSGRQVERVEVKDVSLPQQLQRAMAAEAEAAREARAKVIAAEGEQRASQALKEAATIISGNQARKKSPSSIMLALFLRRPCSFATCRR